MRVSMFIAAAAATTLAGVAAACPDAQPAALTLAAAAARAACLEPATTRLAAERHQAQALLAERQAALSGSTSLQATPQWQTRQPWDGERSTGSTSAGLTLNYQRNLLDGGARRSRIEQSRLDAEAAALGVSDGVIDTQLEFIGLWLDLRAAASSLDAVRAALSAAQQSQRAAQARFEQGSATGVDVLAARAALAQAERDRVAAELTLTKAAGLVAQRLGWPAATPIALSGNDEGAIASATPQESMLDQHPQALAQRQRVLALESAVAATRAEGGASLALTAQAGPSSNRSNSLGAWRTSSGLDAAVGLQFTLPLCDGGSRSAAVARARATLDAARANEATIQRNLRDAFWRALADWRSAEADVAASRTALEAAAASEAAQRGRYAAGVGTVAELLSAQEALAQRRQQANNAEQQRLRRQAALRVAAGLSPLTAPVPEKTP
jgi:outer membrane protein